jgi:ABC-type sugar transport system ATPase subunit
VELSERELEIIFNALGKLHDSSIDGVYKYHRTDEIKELHDKVYQEMKKD